MPSMFERKDQQIIILGQLYSSNFNSRMRMMVMNERLISLVTFVSQAAQESNKAPFSTASLFGLMPVSDFFGLKSA
jgi:hypothetical protein